MFYMRTIRRVAAVCTVSACASVWVGCDNLPSSPRPKYIPPALQYIVDHKGQFTQSCDDPLFDVEPGAIVDDLSGLDGCWGVALLPEPAITVNGEPIMAFYSLDVYDTETGGYTGWLLVQDAFGWLTEAGGVEGTFTVVEGNRIVTQMLRQTGYEPVSIDEPDKFEWVDNRELSEPRVTESLATLSGDRLRIHYGEADREATDPGDDCVYVRFECPEE